MRAHHGTRFSLSFLRLAAAVLVIVTVLAGAQTSAQETTSPDGTTIPHAKQIVDAQGNIWTTNGNAVLENGQIVTATPQLIELLYSGGEVYLKFKDNGIPVWNVWNEAARRVDKSTSPPGLVSAAPLATECVPKSKAKTGRKGRHEGTK